MEIPPLLLEWKKWVLCRRKQVLRYGAIAVVAVAVAGATWFVPPLRQQAEKVWAKAVPPSAEIYESSPPAVQAVAMADTVAGLQEQVKQLGQEIADQKKGLEQAKQDAATQQSAMKSALDAGAQDLARTRRDLATVQAGTQGITLGEPTPSSGDPVSSPAEPAASGRLNINTATAAQLDALPGIGPAYAQRIVDYRDEKGDFKSVNDLDKVSGIGPATIAKIKDLVEV